MKQVLIKRMTLHYFKGILSRTIEFGDDVTVISGPNACGKSTIADAFNWALWGKNAAGQSDTKFLIKTVDKQGVEIPHVNHEVELTLEVDGAEHKFRRTLVPEYTKEGELKGNHTEYEWNNVPMKKSEYDAKVASIIDEQVFKLVSSPMAFMTMEWKAQRGILMNMAGEISDDEVAGDDESLKSIARELTGKTLEEMKREADANIKRINEQMQHIPARIDETHRSMPEMPDLEALRSEHTALMNELAKLEHLERDDRERANAELTKRTTLMNMISEREAAKMKLLNEARQRELKEISERNAKGMQLKQTIEALRSEGQTDRAAMQRSLDAKRAEYTDTSNSANELEKRVEELRNKWMETNSQTFEADEFLRCPLFGHICHDGEACTRYDGSQQETYEKWRQGILASLEDITKTGKETAAKIAECKARLAGIEKEALDAKEAYSKRTKERNARIAELEKEAAGFVLIPMEATIKGEDIPEWVQLDTEARDLQQQYDALSESNVESTGADFSVQKAGIRERMQQIAVEAAKENQVKAAEERIEQLNNELTDLGHQKAKWEFRKQCLTEFELTKCAMVTERVNGMFQTVTWQMFQRQVNGEEVPTCIALVDGVRWTDANTAARINAGIDVAGTLAMAYQISAPIFIDNAECSGHILNKGVGQQIHLRFERGITEMTADKQ